MAKYQEIQAFVLSFFFSILHLLASSFLHAIPSILPTVKAHDQIERKGVVVTRHSS